MTELRRRSLVKCMVRTATQTDLIDQMDDGLDHVNLAASGRSEFEGTPRQVAQFIRGIESQPEVAHVEVELWSTRPYRRWSLIDLASAMVEPDPRAGQPKPKPKRKRKSRKQTATK